MRLKSGDNASDNPCEGAERPALFGAKEVQFAPESTSLRSGKNSDFSKAAELSRAETDLVPDFTEALQSRKVVTARRGVCYEKLGKLSEAEDDFTQASMGNRDTIRNHLGAYISERMGACHIQRGAIDDARHLSEPVGTRKRRNCPRRAVADLCARGRLQTGVAAIILNRARIDDRTCSSQDPAEFWQWSASTVRTDSPAAAAFVYAIGKPADVPI